MTTERTNGHIHSEITRTIGNTPLAKLRRVTGGCAATVAGKLENQNPLWSVKDRIAASMIDAAERDGLLDEALTLFREAIRLNPGMARHPYNVAHHVSNLGTAYHEQGKLPEAAAAFRYALKLKPDEPGMLCNLGRTLQKQGDLAEALVHLKRGHELGSRHGHWSHPSAKWVKDCEAQIEKTGSRP